jgi:hypothetical protein
MKILDAMLVEGRAGCRYLSCLDERRVAAMKLDALEELQRRLRLGQSNFSWLTESPDRPCLAMCLGCPSPKAAPKLKAPKASETPHVPTIAVPVVEEVVEPHQLRLQLVAPRVA